MVILLALDKLLTGDSKLAAIAARSSGEKSELAGVK
jgi:hypothetical protein